MVVTNKDYANDVKPNWCPGCGDFGVLSAIKNAASNLGIPPHQFVMATGIGCSSRLAGYMRSYGFHSIHGRVLPLAQGIKMANRDITVVAAGGDGDGFAIGTNHTIHAIRRNMDITYIVMDNQIYGLTKGQTSPRTPTGTKTNSSPLGNIETPIVPALIALAAGAGFVAQGFSGDLKKTTELIEKGINHKGFSFINIFSPCVSYNKTRDYEWYKQNLVSAEEMEGYDTSDLAWAMKEVTQTNGLITGILHQSERPSYQDLIKGYSKEPLVGANLKLSQNLFDNLLKEYN